MRILATLAATVAMLVPVAGVGTASAVSPVVGTSDGRDAFSRPPAELPARDGDVIRSEPVFAPLPARATRVLYRSRDTRGDPIAVSGIVFEPLVPSAGPRPLVSYALGTQGMADRCAPSHQLAAGTDYENPSVAALLAKGWAVAVTDYQGLGTPGGHPYTFWDTLGRNVLDVARAAQRLGGGIPADGPVAVAGYSQGGGASAAAAELAPTYAPDLDLVGGYAGATPADVGDAARSLDGTLGAGLVPDIVTGLSVHDPSLDPDAFLNATGRAVRVAAADQCVLETLASYRFAQTRSWTTDGRSIAEHLAEAPYRELVDAQRLGRRAPHVPMLVAISSADDLINPQVSRDLARAWCAGGTPATVATTPVPTHGAALPVLLARGIAYLDDRFAGDAPSGICRV